ncbi:DNA polymerase III subunit chi [Cochlodiniinecator piscidefendens]|uniref:DNA polymerase III subunit chi n=1 Tax=Cochlodiniinecator piscidefendens TaxID=2715756 RepID=UPI00140C018D|nr:DNA polymerase III subunit chi [Cochlodiniinecator piscidefendens]
MGAAYFYHLTESPLDVTLPMLLGKAQQVGWRVVVRGRNEGMIDWLDQLLWLGAEDGFLPHGKQGTGFDAEQPILLTTLGDIPNGASCIMSVGGAEVSSDEITNSDRVCILFDGNDPDAVQHARGQWKAITGAGCAAQYWAQDMGSWVKKAESNPD